MFGIIGKSLNHSFSPQYFNNFFEELGIAEEYRAFPLDKVADFPGLLLDNPNLKGLNVTIPYKESIISFLNELDQDARAIGAVNCIKIENGKLKGFNTDFLGFAQTLKPFLKLQNHQNALILGTGGASKAVAYALQSLNISYHFISRIKKENSFSYDELTDEIIKKHTLIINTTPLGTVPEIESCPEIPYNYLTKNHLLYDLIYNPAQSQFLKNGAQQGATIKNGYDMLIAQAQASWAIWQNEDVDN